MYKNKIAQMAINNCLDEPLSKEEQNQAIDILMQELRNDLSN